MSFNTKSGARARVSIPGTGISYSTKLGGKKKRTSSAKRTASSKSSKQITSASYVKVNNTPLTQRLWYLPLAILFLVSGIFYIPKGIGPALLSVVIGAVMCYCFYRSKRTPSASNNSENDKKIG